MEQSRKLNLSRREVIIAGAVGAVGLAVTGVTGCAATQPAATTGVVALPWKYQKLDIDVVKKRGYDNYFQGGCMYGAAAALILTMAETAGGSWKNLPLDAYRYGAGGGYGWGTLCGALNGALAVINLAVENHAALGNDLIGWYTGFPFPTKDHEEYCKFPEQITTVADSPLCHASVSKWATAAKAHINSDEKKDRCAKLTGDTAAKAAEMLNQALEGKFKPVFAIPAEYESCMGCHVGAEASVDNVQGKMNCLSCHDSHQ